MVAHCHVIAKNGEIFACQNGRRPYWDRLAVAEKLYGMVWYGGTIPYLVVLYGTIPYPELPSVSFTNFPFFSFFGSNFVKCDPSEEE